jgi:hypothetical protein
LNDRRSNLCWRTGPEQMFANRIRYAKQRAAMMMAAASDYVPLPDIPY